MLIQQFRPSRIWTSLYDTEKGFPTYTVGATDQGHSVSYEEIDLQYEIRHVLKTGHFLLLPSTATDQRVELPCSALIAPLTTAETPAGVLYVERHADWASYSLSDLDYLMFLALHFSAVLERFRMDQGKPSLNSFAIR